MQLDVRDGDACTTAGLRRGLERYPKARLILGHGGETLPFSLWRFDSRWLVCNSGGREMAQPPSFYIRRNIAMTTSGVCSKFRCAACLRRWGMRT